MNPVSLPTPANKTISTASGKVKRAILEALPIEFDFKGFHYRQIDQKGMVAIYLQIERGLRTPA